jgi:hypothetical protein
MGNRRGKGCQQDSKNCYPSRNTFSLPVSLHFRMLASQHAFSAKRYLT